MRFRLGSGQVQVRCRLGSVEVQIRFRLGSGQVRSGQVRYRSTLKLVPGQV